MSHYTARLDTAIGPMFVMVDESGAVTRNGFRPFEASIPSSAIEVIEDPVRCADVIEQLRQYFRGERRSFNLRLAMTGTPFQKEVWEELLRVPFGTTVSYGEISRRIGRPRAVRAVGAANGANPIAVIVPCHRAVGANGSLTGYGGGMPAKKVLLEHERGA